MVWRKSVIGLGVLALVAGCQGTDMSGEQKATAVGAATGTRTGSAAPYLKSK